MSVHRRRSYPLEPIVRPILRAFHTMPESRLAVLTDSIISLLILGLIFNGDVQGWIGVTGVTVINGVTSGLMYSLGRALEEAEERQEPP